MGWLRSIAVPAALILGFAFPGIALAQTGICEHLEAQLVSLDSNPGSAREADRYREADRAVRRQQKQLDQATQDGRRAGCVGGFFGQLKQSGSCSRTVANIKRMRANLDRLAKARDRYSADPFDDSRERGELVSALARHGCGAQYEGFDRPARRAGFIGTLFGGHLFRERSNWGSEPYGGGAYRTLCVRTCDGYYFPISFSTTQSHFPSDEAVCRAQCPGTDVALYVHRSPGEESDSMVSLAGEPYSALPTAFRYRQTYDKACSCGKVVAASATRMSPVPPTQERAGPDPWGFARTTERGPPGGAPPVPIARPPAEDPETLANRAGSFVPRVSGPAPAAVAKLDPDAPRSVRLVGPSYLYSE